MNTAAGQGSLARKLLGYGGMAVVLLIIGVPLLWVLIASVKTPPDVHTVPATWIPRPVTGENYQYLMEQIPFLTYLRNSFIIAGTLTVVKVLLGVMSAFALVFSDVSRKLRNILFVVIVAALLIPNQITVISNYALASQLGWRNTFVGIIVPLAGVAFGTFLMRNHFLSLPSEVIEAARMDAASPMTLLLRVVLPMSWPTLVAFVLITLVNEWNEYLWPFLMSDQANTAPLPIGLTLLQNNEGASNWGPIMAGTLLTMLPVLIVFLILQKPMIKGLTSGAVKG
ncbi:carbohydrate ABC transporter permease [Devriesea agamarum]|uniref:carbohydrate ABC transporter permease n=1 Tax=Devriesea agamarum TaxID=472569 RepID=UPI00071C2FE0|nr:carbohydrate ABC transporter permease [Devriesea agamarum]